MQSPEIIELLQSGVHFGHKTSKWHPSMADFIFGERKGVHIIDLNATILKLNEALAFIQKLILSDKVILMIGSKDQARGVIEECAKETHVPYITGKWIGGTITNWSVIKKRIMKLNKTREEKAKGEWSKYTKKERIIMDRELQKLERLYSGVDELKNIPDALFVVDCKESKTAIKEAKIKKVPVIALCDTNVNIREIDYPIPANDDAVKSVRLMINVVKDAILEAKAQKTKTETPSSESKEDISKEKKDNKTNSKI